MDEETGDAVREHAEAFENIEPGASGGGETRLRELVAGRRVVGLGTADPGAREPNQFRHRLVRALVAGGEHTVVALPVGFADAVAVDEYVCGERDDVEAVLTGLPDYQLAVESLASTFEWLRAYNADRPDHEQVRVYGLEAGSVGTTVEQVRVYFDRVDPAYLETVRHNLSEIQAASEDTADSEARETLIDKTRRLLPTLRDRLEDHREEYVTAAGLDAWKRARQFVTVLEQHISVCLAHNQHHEGEIDSETRDERVGHLRGLTMADNLDWVVGFEDPAQLLLLANDSDVARTDQTDHGRGVTYEGLGALLDRRYGTDYYAIGTLLGGGTARAGWTGDTDDPVRELEQTERTLADSLGAVDSPVVVLDLTAVEKESLPENLEDEHLAVRSQSQHDEPEAETLRQITADGTVADAFDTVCYFQRVTPVHPLTPERNSR